MPVRLKAKRSTKVVKEQKTDEPIGQGERKVEILSITDTHTTHSTLERHLPRLIDNFSIVCSTNYTVLFIWNTQ